MKKTACIIAMLMIVAQMSAQNCLKDTDMAMEEMPSQSRDMLKQYDHQFVDCKMYNTTNGVVYVAEIDNDEPTIGEEDMFMVFNSTGEMIISGFEEEVPQSSIPPTMTNYIQQNYGSYKIDDIKKVPYYMGVMVYEVDFKKFKDDLIFTMEGNLICID